MRKAPWKLVALLATCHLVIYAVLADEGWIQRSLEAEYAHQATFLGRPAADHDRARATGWFEGAFVNTGVVAGSFNTFTATDTEHAKASEAPAVTHVLLDWFAQRLRVWWTLVFQAMTRFSTALSWGGFAVLVVTPSIVDGWVRRRIKQTNFDYASPDRFGFSVLLAQITLVSFFLLLFAPWAMPVVTAPVCFLLASASLRVMLANVQKRI